MLCFPGTLPLEQPIAKSMPVDPPVVPLGASHMHTPLAQAPRGVTVTRIPTEGPTVQP